MCGRVPRLIVGVAIERECKRIVVGCLDFIRAVGACRGNVFLLLL